jgi:mannose/fructose/N-acetylgalactosamine-specific phosphotransferase system component IIC
VSLLDLLPLVLLGAVCGMDMVSFPQAMISRPLVAATAACAIIGHPAEGLLAGAVLELIALGTLPFGASRYPEWGTASVIGGALFAMHAGNPGALPLAVFAALGAAMVTGSSMVLLRKLNGRLAGRARNDVERGSREAVMRLQITGLVADGTRAAVLTFALLLVLVPIVEAATEIWGADPTVSTAVTVGVAAAVAGGIIWNAVPAGSRRLRAALIGAGVLLAVAIA